MAKERKTKFVILGFLLDESLSGYEIGRMIKRSTNFFWQESDASIYPTLKLLAIQGLVSSETVYVGKRRKEVFTITDAGRMAFTEWFKRRPDQDVHREEFLLKLFFTNDTTQEHMQDHCEERLSDLKEVCEQYKKIEELLTERLPQKRFWLKTMQVGLAHLEVDIAWLTEQQEGIYAANHH